MTIKDYIISEETTLMDTMKIIDRNTSGNAFVCKDGVLIAAISDGDIRRAIMNGRSMDTLVKELANYNPISLPHSRKNEADKFMEQHSITALPILDDSGRIIDIRLRLKGRLKHEGNLGVPVVIMAGGKGTRLKPYTDILPKPLIPIGGETITEHIMDHFADFGCKDFYMIVNYKKNFIKSYFTDSSDTEIKYTPKFVEEQEFLGTGGGLALLDGFFRGTFFLTNCDILIEADYGEILKYHKSAGNIITMICAKKEVVIPYGTVEVDDKNNIIELKEKPTFVMQTNTGFYVIEPDFLNKIPVGTKIDITDIIDKCLRDGEKVGAYLIDDSDWMDMGQLEEMEKMKAKLGIK